MRDDIDFESCSGELWAVGTAEQMWDLIAILRAKGFRIGLADGHKDPSQYDDLLLVPWRARRRHPGRARPENP